MKTKENILDASFLLKETGASEVKHFYSNPEDVNCVVLSFKEKDDFTFSFREREFYDLYLFKKRAFQFDLNSEEFLIMEVLRAYRKESGE